MTETRVRRGAGWWPSLVLWGTVITMGALYLASVEHHRREARDQDRAAAAAVEPLVPAVLAPVSALGSVESSQVEGGIGSGGRVADLAPATVPEAQGPATLGHSASVPAPNPGTASVPLPASASSAAASMAEPQTDPAAAPNAPVTPAEARAFAEAVTEGPPAVPGATPADVPADAPGAASAAGPEPDGAAGDAGSVSAAARPAPSYQAPAGPSRAAERARILAEYEAMQRAAQHEAVLPWSGRGVATQGSGVPPEAPGAGPQRPAAGYYPGSPGN